jgi:hypothetical protein
MLTFTPHATNAGLGGTALQADGGGQYQIQSSPGVNISPGTLIAGTPYTVKYNLSLTTWVLHNFYGNPYAIPLGGLLHSSLPTPPNSSFILPAGQCLSTTTYAVYWASLGSPASGSCPGGQFAVLDTRGRTLVALDNLNGTPAGRLTAGGNGCSTAMTVMGASCLNGTESRTLAIGNLPVVTPTVASATVDLSGGSITIPLQGDLNHTGGAPTGAASQGNNQTGLTTLNSMNSFGSNTPHPTVDPNVAVYVFLRVL